MADLKTIDSSITDRQTCFHCGIAKSPLWRRGERNEVLCNACGLYWKHHGIYRPLPAGSAESPQLKAVKSKSTHSRHEKSFAHRTIAMASFTQDFTDYAHIAHPKYASLPRQPQLRPALAPKPQPNHPSLPSSTANSVKFIMHGHKMLFQGDHVVVRGSDSLPYFAILLDFGVFSDLHRKECKLRWLLPRKEFAEDICGRMENLSPSLFTIGQEHARVEPLSAVIDVFYSPHLQMHSFGIEDGGGARKQSVRSGASIVDEVEAAHFLCSIAGVLD